MKTGNCPQYAGESSLILLCCDKYVSVIFILLRYIICLLLLQQ